MGKVLERYFGPNLKRTDTCECLWMYCHPKSTKVWRPRGRNRYTHSGGKPYKCDSPAWGKRFPFKKIQGQRTFNAGRGWHLHDWDLVIPRDLPSGLRVVMFDSGKPHAGVCYFDVPRPTCYFMSVLNFEPIERKAAFSMIYQIFGCFKDALKVSLKCRTLLRFLEDVEIARIRSKTLIFVEVKSTHCQIV